MAASVTDLELLWFIAIQGGNRLSISMGFEMPDLLNNQPDIAKSEKS